MTVYWNNPGYSTETKFCPLTKIREEKRSEEVFHTWIKLGSTRKYINQRKKIWTHEKKYSTHDNKVLTYKLRLRRKSNWSTRAQNHEKTRPRRCKNKFYLLLRNRSSRKKGVLRYFAKFTGIHLSQSLFFN